MPNRISRDRSLHAALFGVLAIADISQDGTYVVAEND